MIRKFPKLPPKKKAQLIEWLKAEQLEQKSERYKYAACGNEDAAERSNSYASCMEYILMMMEYHEDK